MVVVVFEFGVFMDGKNVDEAIFFVLFLLQNFTLVYSSTSLLFIRSSNNIY